MIPGGRDSGRAQVRREWAAMLPGQGEEAGSLGTRKQASPDVAPAGDLATSQAPVYKKQLSVVYQLVCNIYNSSPKRPKWGSSWNSQRSKKGHQKNLPKHWEDKSHTSCRIS